MKSAYLGLTTAALFSLAATAHAWLGDTREALIQHYGKPVLTQLTTGDIPTQKGYYAELTENYSTNTSLVAWEGTNYTEVGYGMDLVETRTRETFVTNNLTIAVYIGNSGETYNGVDFSGRSAREVIHSGSVWRTDASGDQFTHRLPLSPAVVDAFLDANKGDSTWSKVWRPSQVPGSYLKRTADKMRLAIAHGTSPHDLYHLEVRMIDDQTRAQMP
ncbi:MAG TPA: hypothetical protein VMP11_07520 [Verrucomicrobiae bacterium]|nr:hypothetical protein [Verrucomicrobiae bacterium]